MTYWQAFIFQSDIKHDVYGLLMTHAYLLQHHKKSQNSDVIKDFKIFFVFHAGHVFQQKHFFFSIRKCIYYACVLTQQISRCNM